MENINTKTDAILKDLPSFGKEYQRDCVIDRGVYKDYCYHQAWIEQHHSLNCNFDENYCNCDEYYDIDFSSIDYLIENNRKQIWDMHNLTNMGDAQFRGDMPYMDQLPNLNFRFNPGAERINNVNNEYDEYDYYDYVQEKF